MAKNKNKLVVEINLLVGKRELRFALNICLCLLNNRTWICKYLTNTGYDLQKAQKKGQLVFFDVLKIAHSSYLADATSAPVIDVHPSSGYDPSLDQFYYEIRQRLNQFQDPTSSRPCFIFIDKLSLLLYLNVKLSQVVTFTQKMQQLVEDKDACLGKNSIKTNK